MRASVLSADAFSMSSVIRRVPSREDKTVAARGARDLLRAYDADPASVSQEQLEAVVSQVLRGGGLRSRVSAAGTSVSLPQGTPLIDRVREHLQAVDGLEVDRPLEEGACGSIASSSILSPLSVCHCTETTASPGGTSFCRHGDDPLPHGADEWQGVEDDPARRHPCSSSFAPSYVSRSAASSA